MKNKKVIFIPGNGGGSPNDNWFPSVKKELEAKGLTVIAEEFPDNDLARMDYWVPFILNDLGADENSILVGHSSGAIAAMRVAEQQPLLGSVLVGAYYTDLNMETEKLSGYFDTPWDWDKIRENQKWIIIFAGQDDPWIDISEPRFLHSKLNCEYHEYTTGGHFGGDYEKRTFPELTHHILIHLEPQDD